MKTRDLARLFLLAWHKSIEYQAELLPALADTLGVPLKDVYYHWAIPPRCQQSGMIQGTKWRYFFHGIADCDLTHLEDGRFLQVSFGPYSRYDTCSFWGTMLFIMASKPPWPDYSELKNYFADGPPPYNYLSGSYQKMVELVNPIKNLGLFEVADKKLTQQKSKLSKEFTPIDDIASKLFWDLVVCDAPVLSNKGKDMFANNLEIERFSELWEKRAYGT